MNKHFKTTGVIIRKVDFGEADRIVTVLTEGMGKIDCVAKSARRFKSKFCGRLELFSHISLTCFQGRDLATINDVQLISGVSEEKNIDKHRILFYLAELTNRFIQPGQHIDGVYPLLTNTLEYLKIEDKCDTILHAYLIKLLTLTGFVSPWNKCSVCNHGLELDKPICLSDADLNVVCDGCACAADRLLDMPFIKWVNFMQHYSLPEILRVKTEAKDSDAVWQWLQKTLENILSSPVKSEVFFEVAK